MEKGSNQDEMKYYVKCAQGVKVFYTLQDAWKYYAKMKDFHYLFALISQSHKSDISDVNV